MFDGVGVVQLQDDVGSVVGVAFDLYEGAVARAVELLHQQAVLCVIGVERVSKPTK